MDFGIFNVLQQRHASRPSREVLAEAIEHTRIAESLGYSRSWYAEHHFSNYSLCPSPLIMCAHAAAVTEKIRLGCAVLVLPLHVAARTIGEIAMVDNLSGGRLDVGVGKGYQGYEFDRFGIDIEDRKERFHEVLDMIDAGLTQPHYEHQGDFYSQPQTAINVRSTQQPRPPIWIAGEDPDSFRRCARDGYIPFISGILASPNRLRRLRDEIERSYQAEGKDPKSFDLGVLRFVFVGENREEVESYVESARYQQRVAVSLRRRREVVVDDYMIAEQAYEDELPLERIERNIIAGDVEHVAERLSAEIELYDPSHMAIYFSVGDIPNASAVRSMELFQDKVKPLLEKAKAPELAAD